MKSDRFIVARMQRALNTNGVMYSFNRKGKNDFGEATGTSEEVKALKGIYHEQSAYVAQTTSEGSKTSSKKVPMIMCNYLDTELLKVDDFVIIQNKTFKVTGITNLFNFGSVADISLEVVL